MTTTDEALMAAYQRGDLDAFAELVKRHEKRLWCFVRKFVSDKATAEDLLQEVFLRMIKSAPQWQPTAKVSTWLCTIARNLCTDHARRAGWRNAAPLDGEDRVAARGPSAEGEAMGREIAARVDQAIAALPVEQREVFLMREMMDMPFAEIAAAVGTSEPTVKSRMRYALERLREALEDFRDSAGMAAAGGAGQTP